MRCRKNSGSDEVFKKDKIIFDWLQMTLRSFLLHFALFPHNLTGLITRSNLHDENTTQLRRRFRSIRSQLDKSSVCWLVYTIVGTRSGQF